jgi:gluconolactonase
MRTTIVTCRTAVMLTALASSSLLAHQSPPVPDTTLDLRTSAGAAAVNGSWRFSEAHILETESLTAAGTSAIDSPRKTYTIHPRVGTPDFDAALWDAVKPEDLDARRTAGRLAFAWYRFDFTIPEAVGSVPVVGSEVVFDITVDDYAEVWIDGALSTTLGQSGGPLIKGWNAPNRVIVSPRATPGQAVRVAVFAANGPLSEPPANYVWIRSATLDFYTKGAARSWTNSPVPVRTDIKRVDPALDAIIAPGTQAELLASGFTFTEGPVWVPPLLSGKSYGGGGHGGYLLFSDPNKNVIHRWDAASGEVSIFRSHSGYYGAASAGLPPIGTYHQPGSNGLALDPQGRLAICEHGNRRVTRLEPNGSIAVLADRFDGRRFNSPNDLVYRSDGALYFTDPPFGLPGTFDDPHKELPFSGVFMLKDGNLRLAAKDLAAPNGLALSPDERFLYVDNWEETKKVVLRYAVDDAGNLSNPSVFFDMTSTTGEIALDGLKVDAAGNVFVSGPGGVWIISPAGVHLGTLSIPEQPANFAFGDTDGRTLYLTARSGVYRLQLGGAGGARAGSR